MAEPVKNLPSMTTEEFMRWYEAQPDGLHFELLDGVVYPRRNPAIMQAERLVHAELKARILTSFRNQITAERIACSALGDGMAVRVGPRTTFEPDVLVRAGPSLPRDTVIFEDATIVVEVTSPSTQRLDIGHKLIRYFRNPHIQHYVIIVTDDEAAVIHHRRTERGVIETKTFDGGLLPLDPPGLTLDVDALFADL